MNDKNYDYLSNQLKYTGFGEELQGKLREAMQTGEPAFTLTHMRSYGKDDTVSTLHFKKSDTTDMYFFNKYNLMVKTPQHEHPVKQSFYINQQGESITLKEGYNLLSGRAVHKELANKEGEKYKAWVQLDFRNTDKQGNFDVRQFHEHYRYDLVNELGRHAIADLRDEASKQRLIDSLERGNRQAVTIDANNVQRKVFIEAAPQYKSLNFYDEHFKRINAQDIYQAPRQSNGQAHTTEGARAAMVNEPRATDKSQKSTQKQQDPGGADDDGAAPKKQRKRKRLSA